MRASSSAPPSLILSVSPRRDMLAALVAGDRDQKVLAQLTRRGMHRKITVLDEEIAAQAAPLAEMADHLDEIPGST